jgi:transcriptional regulator with XRE-family HTH domain
MSTNEFNDARAHLDEVERVKRREEKRMASPVDRWYRDGALTHDALDHLRDLRIQEREDLLPDDRRCPRCGVVKLRSRQWIILVRGEPCRRWRAVLHQWLKAKQREMARAASEDREVVPPPSPFSSICRSCHSVSDAEHAEPFLESELWWRVDHRALKIARYNLGLTGAQVAEQCGWSQSRQSKIETRAVSWLHDDDVSRLQLALKLERRPVDGDPERRYRLRGSALKIARQSAGVSRTTLAELCGWSQSRVAKLERGATTVTAPVAEALTEALAGIVRRELDLGRSEAADKRAR